MAKKEDKTKEDKVQPSSYDFKEAPQEKSIEQQVEEKMIELEKQQAETDDIHILDIAKKPPEPGYMGIQLRTAELTTKDDIKKDVVALPLGEKSPKVNSVFKNDAGDEVRIFDPIFDIDLKQMFDGQVSDCASTIFPMLLDGYVQLALDEKKARQTEKRKEEFKWWWIILLMLIIIPILLISVTVLPGLMGGGA